MTAARRGPREAPEAIELAIESLAFGGEGVARREGKVCFVPGALPGERVRAAPMRQRHRWDRLRLIEVLAPSPDRRAPLCPHTAICGGCVLQTLAYEAQLAAKAEQVRDCLERIGGFTGDRAIPEVGPPIGSPSLTAYRNKMEFTFAPRPWLPEGPPSTPVSGVAHAPALGLHVPGRFDAVFDLEECALPSPACVEVLRAVREFARAEGLPAWRSDDESGLLRHLVVREGMRTGEILVAMVAAEDRPAFASLGPMLAERVAAAGGDSARSQAPGFPASPSPHLVGLTLILNRQKAAVARGEEERLLWGRSCLHETLAGLTFELSAQSFFQTNTLGAEALIGAVRTVLGDRAVPAPPDDLGREAPLGHRAGDGRAPRGKLLDLYCGPGTMALALADRFAEVLGVEQSPSAVADARRNAERNGIGNARFIEAGVEQWLAVEAIGGAGSIHGYDGGVLVDPPRAGLHPKAVRGVLGLRPPWILYVSCNPSTLARDAKLFADEGYRALRMQVVDMFPHTAHVETVLLMEREGYRETEREGFGATARDAALSPHPPRHPPPHLL